eukprot:scaffold1808_cov44-Attheya_sp.AAC.1
MLARLVLCVEHIAAILRALRKSVVKVDAKQSIRKQRLRIISVYSPSPWTFRLNMGIARADTQNNKISNTHRLNRI